MAVGMLLAGEGVTEESYKQLHEKMFGSHPMPEGQAPEGCLIHSAGQSEQGWYIAGLPFYPAPDQADKANRSPGRVFRNDA